VLKRSEAKRGKAQKPYAKRSRELEMEHAFLKAAVKPSSQRIKRNRLLQVGAGKEGKLPDQDTGFNP
jgi:hypothetical protein